MSKKIFKQLTPPSKMIRKDKWFNRIFGKYFQNPDLWHLNRVAVANAVSIGLFWTFLPFPGHMFVAAFFAILFHANLPISIILVWIANPLTLAPMLYFSYKLGEWVLRRTPDKIHFEV